MNKFQSCITLLIIIVLYYCLSCLSVPIFSDKLPVFSKYGIIQYTYIYIYMLQEHTSTRPKSQNPLTKVAQVSNYFKYVWLCIYLAK